MLENSNSKKTTLKEKVGAILTLCGIVCGFIAIVSFVPDKNSSELIEYAEMSRNDYIKYNRIAQVYSISAADYWREIILDRKPIADYLYQDLSKKGLTKDIDNAISANFQVPPNDEEGKKLLNEYIRIQKRYPNLVRRQHIFERLKDSVSWVGGMAVFLFLARKIGWKLKKYW